MESSTKAVIGIGAGLGLLYLFSKKQSPPIALPTNLLTNPGFDESGGWTPTQNGLNAQFGLEPAINGNAAVIAYLTNTGTELASYNQIVPVIEGKQYKIGGKIRTFSVTSIPPYGAGITITPRNSTGSPLGIVQVENFITGTVDWISQEKIITIPSGTVDMIISLQLIRSTGKVSFDDIYVYEV